MSAAALSAHEEWRPVPQWEGLYEVSNVGRVRSLDRVGRNGRTYFGRILVLGSLPKGYKTANLYRGGECTTIGVHRLVLLAFIGPCPEGSEGCHNNGNPTDNRVGNLRWDTHFANLKDAVKHGTHDKTKRTHCPRGHLLEPPNLVAGMLRRGRRSCKACHRADAHARYHRTLFSTDLADIYYASINRGGTA